MNNTNIQNNYKIFLSKDEIKQLDKLALFYQEQFPKQKDALSTLIRTIIIKTATSLKDLRFIINNDIEHILNTPVFSTFSEKLKEENMVDDFNDFIKQLLQIYEVRNVINHNTYTEEEKSFRSTKDTKLELENIIKMNLKISNNHIFTDLVKYFIHLSPFKQFDIMFWDIKRHLFRIIQNIQKETIILNINGHKIKPYKIMLAENKDKYYSLIGLNINTNKIVIIPINTIITLEECERVEYFTKEEQYNLELYYSYSTKPGKFTFNIIDNNFDKNTFFLTHPNYQTNKDGSFSMWIRPLEFMELDENIKNNLEMLEYPKRYQQFSNLY